MEIFAIPPIFRQYLKFLNSFRSPTGTKGAPCPPNEISKFLKLVIVFNLVIFAIVLPFPICKVYFFSG